MKKQNLIQNSLMIKALLITVFCFIVGFSFSQKTIINIEESPYAIMKNIALDEISITGGFWKRIQEVNRNVSMDILWDRATNEEYGYSLSNFKIAAGIKEGKQQGVTWQDAWMYKWLETASYEYASTKDKSLLEKMDEVIPIIAKAQEDDGYIATQVTAGKFPKRWLDPSNHELYRATKNNDALELAKHIVDLRGSKYNPDQVNSNWGRPEWGSKELYQSGTGSLFFLE